MTTPADHRPCWDAPATDLRGDQPRFLYDAEPGEHERAAAWFDGSEDEEETP
jgi:hypothetical protein